MPSLLMPGTVPMSDATTTHLSERIQQAVADPSRRSALYSAMKRGRDSRARALAAMPQLEHFQERIRQIKERCLEKQEELIERFSEMARNSGAQVFFAEDGAAAIDYILRLARERGVKTVAKSKSLTSEEIEVNHPLEAAGIQVIETDLGELIIQKVREKPYHLVFPAVHKTQAEVADIFTRSLGGAVPNDIRAIMAAVRKYLRPIFLNAQIGMTGANVGIAENGAIVIETNEGNARLVSSVPDLHVCIMGIEKIVETIDDALQMMLAHPVSAVGQMLTTYVTVMAGRCALGEGGRGPRESHIILLDNGRRRMRADALFKDALNCIRCGACMNVCPTYGVVGGHTFGYIYPGPIGIPWTAQVHGLDKAAEFAPLCISCGLCQEICPAEIDIPMMIAAVKDEDRKKHPATRVNRVMMAAERATTLGSTTAPIANWLLRNKTFRALLEKLAGIDRHRALPEFDRRPFEKQFKKRKRYRTLSQPARRVALFLDLYANYNRPDLAWTAVDCLEERYCEVVVPRQRWSGYPYIGYGDLERAREVAQFNIAQFAPYARDGYDIVAIEPTAAYCLKKPYPKLLERQGEAADVAACSFELFDYLMRLEAQGVLQQARRRLRWQDASSASISLVTSGHSTPASRPWNGCVASAPTLR
ncbi:MAG: LUD domain-containing protein [Candidatus Hydrogenedentes bacterium]|nr:LUD domain-containing protein [Candidatus Hydrogenedentota bacterium]